MNIKQIPHATLQFIGRLLVLVGIFLAIMKWAFALDEIGSWTLLALVPGVILTMIGSREKPTEGR